MGADEGAEEEREAGVSEIWKPVVGYEGLYEVSDQGNVRGLARVLIRANGKPFPIAPRKIVCRCDNSGYGETKLSAGRGQRLFRTHRLVAAAFLVLPSEDQWTVNHINGDRMDNRLVNLEYASPSQQQRHRFDVLRHRQPNGERSRLAKLTWGKAAMIRALHASGAYGIAEMGRMFGVTKFPIQQIVKGRTWQLRDLPLSASLPRPVGE